jgi:PAS domain-containing protein
MHFAGAMLDGSLLIVAARSYSGLARFSQELMSINNEQANALREALKELSLQSRREALRDSRLYDDLSRVNNELTNLQREMVKKNVELEKLSHSLRRSEAKFRTLYDSTSDAVMLLDVKGFFDCNPATLAMFGCASREEFCAKHPADVSPPRQPDGADSVTLANQQIATAM